MKRSAQFCCGIGMFALSACLVLVSACHSYHIDATIKNNTGAAISLLEVDYPTASFGADALASGSEFHHRFQTRDSGPLKVLYSDPNGKQVQITGPTLYEKQEGRLEIVLLPAGKANFNPMLNPTH
jgi:hypothetical protein